MFAADLALPFGLTFGWLAIITVSVAAICVLMYIALNQWGVNIPSWVRTVFWVLVVAFVIIVAIRPVMVM